MTARVLAIASVLALVALSAFVISRQNTSAHETGAEPHKGLFDERWYHPANGSPYLQLSTSSLRADCDGGAASCSQKWLTPVANAITDWNLADTTAVFVPQGQKSTFYDQNIQILDSLCDAADEVEPPNNKCDDLGVQAPFDSNYDYCGSAGCITHYSWVFMNDDQHKDQFGVPEQRQGTTAHELGHSLNLTHESENLPCGKGPGNVDIPHSVMAYNCIDPILYMGGFDEGYVHDWDMCGVNHAYYDPQIGYAGCAPTCGATNPGFETGNLSGWSQGTVTESITNVGVDNITGSDSVAPFEGTRMARLGQKQPSGSFNQQVEGPNELFQVFTVQNPRLRCAYNMMTYDYFGYDETTVEIRHVASDTVIYQTRTGAFGPSGSTELKSTGWRIINVDLSAYLGQQVRLEFAAGGTRDEHYSTWTYLDSAELIEPPAVVDTTETVVDGEPPMINPANGEVIIPQSPGDDDLTITTPVLCPNGDTPTSVTATLTEAPTSPVSAPTLQISLTKGSGNNWTGTFNLPPNQPDATVWDLNYTVVCPEEGNIVVKVGQVILIDPSGYITDAVTKQPIIGATVWLQRFDNGVWHNVDPNELVQDQPTISPAVNPLLTNKAGHYAWDVAAGKYRVVVSAPGYITQTSYDVDIPPPVFDLNLELVPVGGATPTPTQNPTPTATPNPGQQVIWGNVDCSTSGAPVSVIDGRKVVLAATGNPSAQPAGCPEIGEGVQISGGDVSISGFLNLFWGDVDCSGLPISVIDGRKIVLYATGNPTVQPQNCPDIGDTVNLGGSGPTAAPTATPTAAPTATPTATPTAAPTMTPVTTPTPSPTATPSSTPSSTPGNPEDWDCNNLQDPPAIPDFDANGTDLTLSPDDGRTIVDLNVCLNIEHPWVEDLVVTLEHNGTEVRLLERPLCPNGNNVFAFFDDDAPTAAHTSCVPGGTPALEGVYQPFGSLSDFNGHTWDGTWTLNVVDFGPGDTGEVLGASIQVFLITP